MTELKGFGEYPLISKLGKENVSTLGISALVSKWQRTRRKWPGHSGNQWNAHFHILNDAIVFKSSTRGLGKKYCHQDLHQITI